MEAILYQNGNFKTNLSKTLDNICLSLTNQQNMIERQFLNSGRIKHDSDAFSHGLGGKILDELSTDGTAASMGAGHLAPNDLIG